MLIELLDLAILGWLIGTWFYEGHHRKCRVDVRCPSCGALHEEKCSATAECGEWGPPPKTDTSEAIRMGIEINKGVNDEV